MIRLNFSWHCATLQPATSKPSQRSYARHQLRARRYRTWFTGPLLAVRTVTSPKVATVQPPHVGALTVFRWFLRKQRHGKAPSMCTVAPTPAPVSSAQRPCLLTAAPARDLDRSRFDACISPVFAPSYRTMHRHSGQRLLRLHVPVVCAACAHQRLIASAPSTHEPARTQVCNHDHRSRFQRLSVHQHSATRPSVCCCRATLLCICCCAIDVACAAREAAMSGPDMLLTGRTAIRWHVRSS